ncbi:MAG: DNA/RNA non-specific endonuclease [Phycisphaerae bacterium]|nr:DNA/RNA non-specific endonuclease [Phycisphaerae bacterium]
MSRNRALLAIVCVTVLLVGLSIGQSPSPYSTSALNGQETTLTKKLEQLAEAKTDLGDSPSGARWVLRSKHFVFGMPQLKDARYNFKPLGDTNKRPGVSVLVREGFVVGYSDRLRSPLWVCQRWTKVDYKRMKRTPAQSRKWKEDLELPRYARAGGVSYDWKHTKMDCGHMAGHACNRAWGVDTSKTGCLMSNSTPQHKRINRGAAWRNLEDAARDIVSHAGSRIDTVWTISGAIFRRKDGQGTPETDFQNAKQAKIGSGYPVPTATYKIVAWFDEDGHFQVRGYVFEQSDKKTKPTDYLKAIDKIETRAGIDFFPMLKDSIEDKVEAEENDDMWGAK